MAGGCARRGGRRGRAARCFGRPELVRTSPRRHSYGRRTGKPLHPVHLDVAHFGGREPDLHARTTLEALRDGEPPQVMWLHCSFKCVTPDQSASGGVFRSSSQRRTNISPTGSLGKSLASSPYSEAAAAKSRPR